MKKLHLYILALLSLVFASCENSISKYTTDIYLTNQLESAVNLEIFRNEEILNFNLNSNDTAYLATIEYTIDKNVRYCRFPGDAAYEGFRHTIDSVNVVYNSNKFTYYKNDTSIYALFPFPNNTTKKGWIVAIEEFTKQYLGWDNTTDSTNTDILNEERHVASVYLVNHLDKPIDLEMYHDSIPQPIQEELLWYRNAGIQSFTLQPNDTVYCDSVVYLMDDDVIYFTFPGFSSYDGFVDSYKFIKIDYNGKQYEYTNKADIKNLLRAINYWYIEFNEEKKNAFGWDKETNPDTTTNDNRYTFDVYLNNQLENTIKLEVFRNKELSTFNLTPNITTYFTTIEYYMYEGENYIEFPGDAAYDDYIGSIDSINVFYNDKKYTYINKPYEQNELEYFFRKHIQTVIINKEKENYLGWK